MPKPDSPKTHPVHDLPTIEDEMRSEDAYERSGHTARTLIRASDLRLVLIAMKSDSTISEHKAPCTASIHLLRGEVVLGLPDGEVRLIPGQVATLEGGMRHDVHARSESALLLTLGKK